MKDLSTKEVVKIARRAAEKYVAEDNVSKEFLTSSFHVGSHEYTYTFLYPGAKVCRVWRTKRLRGLKGFLFGTEKNVLIYKCKDNECRKSFN